MQIFKKPFHTNKKRPKSLLKSTNKTQMILEMKEKIFILFIKKKRIIGKNKQVSKPYKPKR